MNIEELEAALSCPDVGAAKAFRAKYGQSPTFTKDQASRTLLNLLRAIDEKRLAVVPCEPTDEQADILFQYGITHTRAGMLSYSCYEAYRDTISAVDQQAILKELEG